MVIKYWVLNKFKWIRKENYKKSAKLSNESIFKLKKQFNIKK